MSVINSGAQNNVQSVRYKETTGFTGNIMYFNPNGTMANGWAFRDGATLDRISPSNEAEYKSTMRIKSEESKIHHRNGGKLALKQAVYCTSEYLIIYGTSCVGVEGFMNCTQYVVSRQYLNNCEYGGGGGDGGYTPPTPGGGGGTTTGTAPAREITNKITDPCLKKTVDEALASNKDVTGLLSDVINRYSGKNNGIKVTLQNADIPEAANARTSVGVNTLTISITFKTGHFNESTKEAVVATLIHEVVHSYVSETNPAYRTQPKEQQHNFLFTNFIKDISSYLQSKYNMPVENAWGLAWSGVGDVFNSAPSGTTFAIGNGKTMTKEEIVAGMAPYSFVGKGSKGTPNCP